MPTATYSPPPAQTPVYQPHGFDPRVLPQGSNPNALTIDQVNIAMRASPVWNSWMQQHGQNPANVHLSDSDKNGLGKTLELAGFPLPNGWEIDNSGNIREETHIGRNILIAAAIAGAAFGGYALLTAYGVGTGAAGGTVAATAAGTGGVEAGATAGLGTAAMSGTLGSATAGSAAMGLGTASAAGAAGAGAGAAGAFDAAGNFIGPSTVSGFGGAGATYGAGGSGFTGAALQYGVPVAGNVISSLIQANAAGNASEAQQRYLEEALAYQKEQDAYRRATEAARYATYSSNVAPYIARGTAAGNRMSSLLGLPATTTQTSLEPRFNPAVPSPAPRMSPPAPAPTLEPTPEQTSEPMVTLQAPTGETQEVPQSQVDHYVRLGAKPVGRVA